MESILTSIKKLLGLMDDDTSFDTDITIYINSALADLAQLGIGPASGFSISDKYSVWTDFVPASPLLEPVKTYVYLKVKLVFDPPQPSAVLESINKLISQLEFRLSVTAENVKTTHEEDIT